MLTRGPASLAGWLPTVQLVAKILQICPGSQRLIPGDIWGPMGDK